MSIVSLHVSTSRNQSPRCFPSLQASQAIYNLKQAP